MCETKDKVNNAIDEVIQNNKLIDAYAYILELWRKESTDENILNHAIVTYTKYAFKNGKYRFESKCKNHCTDVKRIEFKNTLGAFCPKCGELIPF